MVSLKSEELFASQVSFTGMNALDKPQWDNGNGEYIIL